MISILFAGFLLGFAGSLHCVGMCGPLSLALPTKHLSPALKLLSLLTYQSGRIITYSLLGLLFGIAGRGIYIAGIQQWFSITLGILILMFATFYFMDAGGMHLPVLSRFYMRISAIIGRIIKHNYGLYGFLLLGMANGLLPCGMVYIALVATLSFSTLFHSVGFMAMFGAGTLPAMMLVAYGGQMFGYRLKHIFKKSVPYFITAAGLILILRGMNLGLPFISPILRAAPEQAINCH